MATLISALLQLIVLPFVLAARIRDRLMGALVVHVDGHKFVGQRSEPGIWIQGIWTENTSNQNAFVNDYEIRLTAPVEAATKSVEWRERGRSVVLNKGQNVPALSRTVVVDIVALFDKPVPAARGNFTATVTARGRKGFRGRGTTIKGEFHIADS